MDPYGVLEHVLGALEIRVFIWVCRVMGWGREGGGGSTENVSQHNLRPKLRIQIKTKNSARYLVLTNTAAKTSEKKMESNHVQPIHVVLAYTGHVATRAAIGLQ